MAFRRRRSFGRRVFRGRRRSSVRRMRGVRRRGLRVGFRM